MAAAASLSGEEMSRMSRLRGWWREARPGVPGGKGRPAVLAEQQGGASQHPYRRQGGVQQWVREGDRAGVDGPSAQGQHRRRHR